MFDNKKKYHDVFNKYKYNIFYFYMHIMDDSVYASCIKNIYLE